MIKKVLILKGIVLFGLIIIIGNVQAQSVLKGLSTDNSTFLLGATNARKSQCLYRPSDFTSMPFNGEINRIYYRYGSTGIAAAHDLSPFTIKMGQTTDTVFSADTIFFTGLTTVRFDSIYTIPVGVQGSWFGIDLQTPFVYDSSKTLIVEIKFFNTTAATFGTLGNNNTTQKLISSDTAAVAQTSFGSTTWQDFGFNYLITTGFATIRTNNNTAIFPNPTHDILHLSNLLLKEDATLCIYDVYGNVVYTSKVDKQNSGVSIDLSSITNGVYSLKLESKQMMLVRKILKI